MNGPFRRSRPIRGRNDRCPCGSGKKRKRCCAGPGKTVLFTSLLPGATAPPGSPVEEGVVELTPERQEELMLAFAALEGGERPDGHHCPICALQQRWAEEDGAPPAVL